MAWAYRTGGQVATWGTLPATNRNMLLDMQAGEDFVLVTEGQKGGQCSATPQSSLKVTHALDLKTGRPVISHGPVEHIASAEPVCVADGGHWETRVGPELSVYSAGETGCLYVRTPSEVLLLRVIYPGTQQRYAPFLGVPISAFRTKDNHLIVGLSQGYIVCVDLNRLETNKSTD